MDRMLYIAMSGASETMTAQAVKTNNLANVSTTGFKADLAQARSMPVFGPGLPSRAYAMTERPGTDFNAGSLVTTGRELDVAVQGDGWLAVIGPDGEEGYTRAGDLHISPNGLLTTGNGNLVVGDGGPIGIPPAEKVEIGADGTVSIRPVGQGANALVQIGRLKLVNPEPGQLEKGESGLFRLKEGGEAPADANVRVVSGMIEGSNVNPVAELVDMINLARRFETQVKMMETAKENESATAQMLRMA